MLEVERIIEREKDRVQSRRDQQTNGKISALHPGGGCRRSLCMEQRSSQRVRWIRARRQESETRKKKMKKRLSRRDVQGARLKQRQERCSKGAVKQREVKVKEAKERRVASASLVAKKAEEGHLKAQCPLRWYVPKTVFGNWWNSFTVCVVQRQRQRQKRRKR